MIGLIDSHIHLDDARFDCDRNELIKMAQMSGVTHFIVPAVNSNNFSVVAELAQEHNCVFHTLGLHPYYINQHSGDDLDQLAAALGQAGVVGVGECGLDFYLKDLDREKQKLVFEAHVVLAKHFDLPLILHVRGAIEEVFQILKKHDYFKAVMHSFNGSIEQAKQVTAQGVYLGFGPAVCNPQAHKLKAMVREVDINHIMLETDAPDQPFYDRFGKRNLPIDLLRVNEEVASIKNIESTLLAAQTTSNTKQLFNL